MVNVKKDSGVAKEERRSGIQLRTKFAEKRVEQVKKPQKPPTPTARKTEEQKEMLKLQASNDVLEQRNRALQQRIQELEDQVALITSRGACTTVATQTSPANNLMSSTGTQSSISARDATTSPKKLHWQEASTKNLEAKRKLTFHHTKPVSFESVTLPELLGCITCDGRKLFNRKSTVASVYCFTENVHLSLGFVHEAKGKLSLSDGLARLIPGKPKAIDLETWSRLPSVLLDLDLDLRVISSDGTNIILILKSVNLQHDFDHIVKTIDAANKKNLTLGIDNYSLHDSHDMNCLHVLSLLHQVKDIRFCFYSKGGRNIDYLIREDDTTEDLVTLSETPSYDSNRRKSISSGDLPGYFKLAEENEELRQTTDELTNENTTMRLGLMDREETIARLEYEIANRPNLNVSNPVLDRIIRLEEIMLKLDDKVSSKQPPSANQNCAERPEPKPRSLLTKPSVEHVWLSDDDVNHYFNYLTRLHPRQDVLLVDPILSHMIKHDVQRAKHHLDHLQANKKTFIILPVNDADEESRGGTHWSLLLYDTVNNTFWNFDSMTDNNLLHGQAMARNMGSYLNLKSYSYIKVNCPQQNDSFSCGAFMLYFAHNIINKIKRSARFSQKWFFFKPEVFIQKVWSYVEKVKSAKSITGINI